MIKKLTLGLMIIIFLSTGVASARTERITLDGIVVPTDVIPMVMNGSFMVPLSAVGKHAGAEVIWDPVKKTVTMDYDGTIIVVKIGDANATVDGRVRPMKMPATIVRHRTMVTAAFMADCIGAEVDWDYHSTTIVFNRVHDSTHKLESR